MQFTQPQMQFTQPQELGRSHPAGGNEENVAPFSSEGEPEELDELTYSSWLGRVFQPR